MLKKKITKVSATIKKRMESGKALRKYLACKVCNEVEVEVQVDIAAVTCSYCVQRQVAPPENYKSHVPEGEKFPRGWALKAKYVHTDGRVFEKGKEVTKTEPPKKEEKKEKKTVTKVAKKQVKRRK